MSRPFATSFAGQALALTFALAASCWAAAANPFAKYDFPPAGPNRSTFLCDGTLDPKAILAAASGPQRKRIEAELAGLDCAQALLPATPAKESSGAPDETHTGWTYDAAFSADGKLIASAGFDGTLRLWDAATGRMLRVLATVAPLTHKGQPQGRRIRSLAFLSGTQTLAYAADGYNPKIVDLEGREFREIPAQFESSVPFAARIASGGGLLLVGSEGETVEAYHAETFERVFSLPGHAGGAGAVAVSDRAGLIATTRAKPKPAILLWRLGTGQAVAEITLKREPRVIAFSPDGLRFASSADGSVQVFSIADQKLERTLNVHPMFSVFDLAFTADGQGLVTCRSHPQLWDLKTGEMTRHFGPFTDLCHSVAMSPDGRHAVTTAMGSDLRIWDVATGAFHRRLGRNVTARY
ncbi:MAG TPA: hypothetical protein VIL65_09160 [Beijerinckiaceae bacterium]